MCPHWILVAGVALIVAWLSAMNAAVGGEQPAGEASCEVKSLTPWMKLVPVPDPFLSNVEQEEELDRLLADWETRQGHVRTVSCNFTLWEYNRSIEVQPKEHEGQLRYAWPDKAHFHILGKYQEEWLRDGRSFFEVYQLVHEIREYRLPADRVGKPIHDWPLPFLYGVKAANLRSRYWIKITTPQDVENQVWLEFRPRAIPERSPGDWLTNLNLLIFLVLDEGPFNHFKQADLILTKPDLAPYALRIHDTTGHSSKVFLFTELKLDAVKPGEMDIRAPMTFGWRRVVIDVPNESFDDQRLEPTPPRPKVRADHENAKERKRENKGE